MFVPECVSTISELISLCHKDEIIIYGTGKIGKLMIPYLQRNTDLKILGVTNSHVTEEDNETFLNTGLPMRSPQAWFEQFPHATIVISVVRQDFQFEIADICKQIGFQRIFGVFGFIQAELLSAHARSFFSPENMAFLELLKPYIDFYFVNQMCIANEIQDLHRASFAEFRGCHKNQTVAVVGSGPTLNYYKQLDGVPHIGVNTVFLKPGIKLDYYFARDYLQKSPWFSALKDYDFVKFFGISEWTDQGREIYQIPESFIEENHGRRFISQTQKEFIHFDIEHYPLMSIGSIIFAAVQFALHTRPKRILLVGCDCSNNGYYDKKEGMTFSISDVYVDGWKWIKEFINRFYPSIEIVSVNPVGLKGMFRDVYTEDYLTAHPELDRSACTLIDSLKNEIE